MAKKKKASKGLESIVKSMKGADIQGIAVVVLANDGQIMIGSEGLDRDTCQSLLSQSADLMLSEYGNNQTLH